MKRIIINRAGRYLLIVCLLGSLSFTAAHSQILIGADYGLEYASLNGYHHTRSGGQLSASYFINPNIAFRLTISAFNKELVDDNFQTFSNWTSIYQLLSANYYFLTSSFRPYFGFGVGQYNDKLSNKNISGYFNDNSIFIAPEIGFLASVSPKLKLNYGFRYNYIFGSDGVMMNFIGLKIPLTSF